MKKIFLSEYQKPEFKILDTKLNFDLHSEKCIVKAQIQFQREYGHSDLFLNGVNLKLNSISLDGKLLNKDNYELSTDGLILKSPPDKFTLQTECEIDPYGNESLEGFYKAGNVLLSQCEAQGFRKITYYLDRPDILAPFQVSISADKTKFPILLSNGNLLEKKDLENNRHQTVWQDPFPKPCYLFAIVAGDLAVVQDHFLTQSGKNVKLSIYCGHGQQKFCHHAMDSLKKSMAWDEKRFGLEYDLQEFMILVTDDFNGGAMENKGLNIFNSRYVLADYDTATDDEFLAIESVVAHEYFHNWTGNRVTLRDWFHLSLKEGLTVFRDQEFSADMDDPALTRIKNVQALMERQFAEDAGPNAHPVRPEFCYAVDNFYTPTIYEKGAELIRMLQTILGKKGFRAGMDLYFKRHDGQAVIIEDFIAAMADANGKKLDSFKAWYRQTGTPIVKVQEKFEQGVLTLNLMQSLSKNSPEQGPLFIPTKFNLLDKSGQELSSQTTGVTQNSEGENLIILDQKELKIQFSNLKERPRVSLLHDFSAPVNMEFEQSREDLQFLARFDSNPYKRLESIRAIQKRVLQADHENFAIELKDYSKTLRIILADDRLSDSFKAASLEFPNYLLWAQQLKEIQSVWMQERKILYHRSLFQELHEDLMTYYYRLHDVNPRDLSSTARGKRALKNQIQYYMIRAESKYRQDLTKVYRNSENMTERIGALSALSYEWDETFNKCLTEFYERYKNNPLVLNKWLMVQAMSDSPHSFENLQKLSAHPAFNIKNPNNVYSSLRAFSNHLVNFHAANPKIYHFYLDKLIEIDKFNPHVSAILAKSFQVISKLEIRQANYLRDCLGQCLKENTLSKNAYEILEAITITN